MISCGSRIKIERPDLYTVAMHSLLWTNGFSQQSDYSTSPEIRVLETDSYGRIMFSYSESRFSGGEIAFTAVLICQKTTDQTVWFYPDYNFITIKKDPYGAGTSELSENQLSQLKESNDWEKKLNLESCVQKEVRDFKESVPLEKGKSNAFFQELLSRKYGEIGNCSIKYMTADDYGRTICYGWADLRSTHKKQYFAILLNSDLTVDLETGFYNPTDFYSYQDELHDFKTQNHWGRSF